MTAAATAQLAFDGSGIDGSLFTSVTDFARDTKWLNAPMETWTNLGLGVFALGPENTDAGSDKVSAVTAQMYCERMELHLLDKAPKPEIVR